MKSFLKKHFRKRSGIMRKRTCIGTFFARFRIAAITGRQNLQLMIHRNPDPERFQRNPHDTFPTAVITAHHTLPRDTPAEIISRRLIFHPGGRYGEMIILFAVRRHDEQLRTISGGKTPGIRRFLPFQPLHIRFDTLEPHIEIPVIMEQKHLRFTGCVLGTESGDFQSGNL